MHLTIPSMPSKAQTTSMTTWEPGIFVMHGMVYEHQGKTYRAAGIPAG